ncbi:Uncharacterised protein [Mycobacteroides abscessus subsp. abscessus]|nr:Uncharacterised protein [Mycobacteroides abscessus subsp. abscessus]
MFPIASRTVIPARSVTASISSWSISPAKTELPMIDGANRPPSSLNQSTTATLYLGCAPPAVTSRCRRSAACSAAMTP